MTAADPDVLRVKVQRIVADRLGTVEVDKDGDVTFAQGSTRVWIRVIAQEERSVVKVFAPIVTGVKATPELFRWLALASGRYLFGSIDVVEKDDTLDTFFYHCLLGDFLDPEELHTAIGAVVLTADELDDELREEFGGKRWTDED